MSKGFAGLLITALIAGVALVPGAVFSQGTAPAPAAPAAQSWLPTLITDTPEEGYALAVRLARRAIGLTQPDVATRRRLRPDYADNADSLIAVSHLVAVHFATVAAANNYWRR